MNTRDLLLAYGEWLAAQSLLVDEQASGDKRSLEALATEFLAEKPASRSQSPAVVIRGESVEAMRAALAGMTAERDALREELETAAWERDNAQNESAFLREDVLHVEWNPFLDDATPPERTIGLLLTAGDTPPPPSADIALVSMSSGAIYVRADTFRNGDWCEYGQDTTYSDWASMTDRGPWVTVGTYGLNDHKAKAQARRRLKTAIYSAKPYNRNLVAWPENATWALDAAKALGNDWRSSDQPDAWIDKLSALVGACRSAWADDHAKLAALIERDCAQQEKPVTSA